MATSASSSWGVEQANRSRSETVLSMDGGWPPRSPPPFLAPSVPWAKGGSSYGRFGSRPVIPGQQAWTTGGGGGSSGALARPGSRDEAKLHKSLEEISKEIRELDDFITVTEDILRREREQDELISLRERQRKAAERTIQLIRNKCSPTKKCFNRSTTTTQDGQKKVIRSPTYKVNITQKRRIKSYSPKGGYKSKLYFRNGKIGCQEAENSVSNLRSTHELVKRIINDENNMLVKLEHQHFTAEKDGTDSRRSSSVETPVESVQMCITESAGTSLCDDEAPPAPQTVTNPDRVGDRAMINDQPLENANGSSTEMIEDRRNSVTHSEMMPADENDFVTVRLRHLASRFSERTRKMRSKIEIPPTPSSSASAPSTAPSIQKHSVNQRTIQNSALTLQSATDTTPSCSHYLFCPIFCCGGRSDNVLDPQGKFYISWLFIVSLSFLYNAWVIPLRSSFPYQTPENTKYWIAMDICADVIYLLDILFVKHRLMYLYEGFWVKDKHLTRKNYMRKLQFKMDLLALVPLDLLYLRFGTEHVVFRAPRLLKIQSFWEFFKLIDRVISSPHIIRVVKTLTYMLYMIHLTACAYYAYSAYQGLGSNRWVFNNKGHAYVRCFAFATKTATSIGKNPKPEKEGELMFMTAAWLMGVFVFALLIGQIRDIIATATRSKSEYKQLVDETLEYMRRLNLPTDLQRRVKMWFTFTWEQQKCLDETHIMDALPANLKTDIAISVHIQTLSKVQLFADCEEALLRELVLKLRSVTFLPGDYVCRKGEVGKEMYIVKTGQVQVMGGSRNDVVLATLYEGSVFGEISLLAINGAEGNRRTADVRSKGFSNLFVLSKSDLNEAIVYYPNAQAILKKRAKSLMRKNAAREKAESQQSINTKDSEVDVVIRNPTDPTSPKLLKTVIQALPQESAAVQLLMQGFKPADSQHLAVDEQLPQEEPIPLEEPTVQPADRDDTVSMQSVEIKHTTEVQIENEKNVELPCDLVYSIKKELMENNSYINLTDTEKYKLLHELSKDEYERQEKSPV
ncbi:cyclic nucleotide-gated channel rod photoreceptor subunit alpha [Anopheles ziemanni]|uniref:cyclic nucleotide-gated channel rod photoreceptor subunit alpha n=1 Tax=Anopheles coustani TaxID=139045 RepID=UPI00265A28FD|nr:cyclic nucleotide-gated channel rod photoreceptor subunit alpha [Anopheles coustani]XP_058172988.1 cyclic nucleotide-gated channel rod photoreceptor subunit alpha [Anopheles ziemanni]